MLFNLQIIQDKNGAINVLHDVSLWLEETGRVHSQWWKSENMNEDFFSNYAESEEFYCGFINNEPAACVILQDSERNQSWEYIDHNDRKEALYLHWLAVKRKFAGNNLSSEMVDFAQKEAVRKGLSRLRLDTDANNEKLMKLYKKLGFKLMEIEEMGKEKTAYFQKDII